MKSLKIVAVVALLCAIPMALVAWVGWDNILGFFREPVAEVTSPKQLLDGDVSFSYPSNWRVESSKTITSGVELRTHQVESAGSALVIVQTFHPAVPLSLDEYMKGFVKGFDEEIASNWAGLLKSQGLREAPMRITLLGEERDGKELKLTLRALDEKVPFTLELVAVVGERTTAVVLSLVPEDGREAAQPGVDLVRRTFALANGR